MTALAGPVAAEAERVALGATRSRVRRRRRVVRGESTGAQAVLVALWCLLPVYWMVAASLREPGNVYEVSPLPSVLTFRNYVDAMDPVNDLGVALLHSLGIASLVTFVALLLAVSGGYVLARMPFRGRGVLIGAILAASMLPAVALLTPLFAFFSRIGWSGTFQALLLPYVALAMPFAVYTLGSFFREAPWELEDAALVDGCSRAGAFARVMLPLLGPSVITVALLTFIVTWNEYVIAFVLSVDSTITVTVVIANFAASLTGGAVTMAAGVIATLPPLVLVLVFQRRITAGLTAGGVKG